MTATMTEHDAALAVLRSNGGPTVLAGSRQERTVDTRITTEALTALEAAARAAAVAAERALAAAEVLDEVMAVLAEPHTRHATLSPCRDTASGIASLSPREREVLALVAEGRTNKEIADALDVSSNTVKTHVTALLTKLRADSRVQLATMATRQDMHRRVVSRVPIDSVPAAEAHSRR